MENILKVEVRSKKGKIASKVSRRSGMIPSVMYARGRETRELLVNERDFGKMLEAIRGKSTMIDLQVADEAPIKCIIKQIQRHAITLRLVHVDFQEVHAAEKLTINVPLHLEGTPVGIKMGGLLDHSLREIPVRGLPADLPANITLDIASLKVGQSLHVSDIKLDRVEIQLPGTAPLVSVLAPKKVEEAAPVAAEAVEGEAAKEPEVISEKKAAERAEERAKAEADAKGGKPKEEKKEEKKK